MKCDYCGGELTYRGSYAAPGTGQSWKCSKCEHPYKKMSTYFIDERPKPSSDDDTMKDQSYFD